ncbi:hypothetical protein BDZ91DRAFT_663842 [Kalaharituber pfeilii]|nr:hypothetical protein BDZ91DRAFT_663842 [Kalaharituber pfeilii]
MHALDPSSIASALDPHFTQRAGLLQNGNSRNPSPGYQPQQYQVNPVVPLKRPRREDSISLSPRQAPGALPPSRSQTPLSQNSSLGYQLYPNNQATQRTFPNQYQYAPHLSGSLNTSPSPVLQNQTYPQSGVVATGNKMAVTQASSPFSPTAAQQTFMQQASPTQAEHLSRVGTPQSTQSNGTPQPGYPQGFNPTFSGAMMNGTNASGVPTMAQPQASTMQAQMVFAQLQQQHQRQRMMQQQQQQQQQQPLPQGQLPGQHQQRGMKTVPMPVKGQVPQQSIPRQAPTTGARQPDQNSFFKSLSDLMQSRGTPITSLPTIGDKQVNLAALFGNVFKSGGSRKVTEQGRWAAIAASIGFPVEAYPNVLEEIQQIFQRFLSTYEAQQQISSQSSMGQGQARIPLNAQPLNVQNVQPQGTPSQLPQSQAIRPPQTPVKQANPAMMAPARQGMTNGYVQSPLTPHHPSMTPTGNLGNRSMPQGSPTVPSQPQFNFPASMTPKPSVTGHGELGDSENNQNKPANKSHFKPKARGLDTHGGVDVAVLSNIGMELNYFKPTVPSFTELGVVDIHALTMSLKSGLLGEVRLALDTLATVSVESRWSLSLESCEDLVETLVDVADEQAQFLGAHAVTRSADIRIPSYEDVMRGCRAETEALAEVPKFGCLNHRLEKAAERLICITTIFRNLSFFESNHGPLADANVVKFLSKVIKLLGTKRLLLRTHQNTLDFLKDIIIYLSNLSQAIILPGQEEALNLLLLILAFAPQPLPAVRGFETLMFTPYQPSIHRYLPPAVDSLAKILARDEPNRSFYRSLFLAESNTTPRYDLMTRAFGLAISPIPDNTRTILSQTVEARRPFLEQGMLAAEIIAGMAPGPEDPLAKSWLSSEDGFALSLLRLVCLLSPRQMPPPGRMPQGKVANPEDVQPFSRITHRGMSVLHKLAEKSEDPNDPVSSLPLGILPKKESLLGALLTVEIDGEIVKQLCSYAGLNA